MFSYVESLVKRKGAQDLARYERGTAAKKRKEEKSFRQLQETAMAHEEQGTVVWLRILVLKYGIAL